MAAVSAAPTSATAACPEMKAAMQAQMPPNPSSRWPTAAAVVADLWDLVRARHGASEPEAARRVAEAVA